MTAVLVPAADEAEWLAARRKGVTASEIASLMGVAPAEWESPFSLYHRKRGDLPEQPDTDRLSLGQVLEPYVAERFADRYPEYEVTGDGRRLFARRDRPWQLATPDRLITEDFIHADLVCCDLHKTGFPPFYGAMAPCCDPDDCGPCCEYCVTCPAQNASDVLAVLECKTSASYDGWGDDLSDDIPVHYRCQVLWQMDVMGLDSWFVACLFLPGGQLRVYEGTMDDAARADLKLMREAGRRFLERIDHGDPPEPDWRPATSRALRALHPSVEDRDVTIGRQLAISYRAAQRNYKAAEKRKDEMTNRLLDAMGTARRAVEANTDRPVATRSVSEPRRISTSKLRESYPDAAAACTVRKPETRLAPARLPKETPQP